MRYLIDTNILIYAMTDLDSLSRDVRSIIEEPETLLCISAESVRELIVAYRKRGISTRKWKTARDMVDSIENEYYVQILPVGKEHMRTMSELTVNEQQDHKDPSDYVIISHAITEGLPLISSDSRFGFYQDQGLDLIFNSK